MTDLSLFCLNAKPFTVWLVDLLPQLVTLTNTPRVFHVETTWKQSFPLHFNVEYTFYVCRDCT